MSETPSYLELLVGELTDKVYTHSWTSPEPYREVHCSTCNALVTDYKITVDSWKYTITLGCGHDGDVYVMPPRDIP